MYVFGLEICQVQIIAPVAFCDSFIPLLIKVLKKQ